MNKNLFRSNPYRFLAIFGFSTGLSLYRYSDLIKNLFLSNSHPTKQCAEMLIKLDNRITNFCGFNYKISGFKLIDNSEKYQSYRMNLKGIRGDCKVLVKVQKLDCEELKFLSDQQKKISLMSYEQRKKEPFVPIDFTDVLLPTQDTMNNVLRRVKEMHENLTKIAENSEEYYNFNKNEALDKNKSSKDLNTKNKKVNKFGLMENKEEITYEIFEKLNNLPNNKQALKEYIDSIKIQNKDTFYRFMNISVSYSENAIFNIRPLNIKFRDYDLIDTEFTDKTFLDIFKKFEKVKLQYEYKNNCEISAQELKDELKTSKQNYFKEKLEKRGSLIKWQLLLMIGIVFFYKQYFKCVNYQRIYSGVVENLSKNKHLKEKLGTHFHIPYVAFRYNLIRNNFSFNCVALSGNNQILVKGKSLPNAENVLPTLNFYDEKKNLIKV